MQKEKLKRPEFGFNRDLFIKKKQHEPLEKEEISQKKQQAEEKNRERSDYE